MNTLTLDSMAFDNFEIANNEYLATTEGEDLGSALWGGTVEGLDKAFTWGAAGALAIGVIAIMWGLRQDIAIIIMMSSETKNSKGKSFLIYCK
ncbi:hypothetical protein SMU105_04202 [Streptococcus mutans SF12]|nr:hypothetical protein [Streptococcus mutans]EMC54050.1 hypothetical protein SMU105_04202 [Streptococcus mutans SF12]